MDRVRAIEIAREAAKRHQPSYYAEPFEPHAWVVDAIIEAAQLPDACISLVDYIADRVIDDADFGYYVGPGTQTLHLLVEAVAALEGGDREEIRRDLSQPYDREPDVVRYRERAEVFQRALERIRDANPCGHTHDLAADALEEVA